MLKVDEPERLDDLMEKHGDNSTDFKILVLKLVSELQSVPKVSKLTGVPERTIRDWVNKWNKKKTKH